MIAEGKIDDVFAIIIKLKENNVTQIMKFLSVSNAFNYGEVSKLW